MRPTAVPIRAILAVVLVSFATPAIATPDGARGLGGAASDCDPVTDLVFGTAEPALRQIAAGVGRLHFVKNGSAHSGCPNPSTACVAPFFVVGGDRLIVTGTRGEYACATFIGPAPKAPMTSGWLPKAALAAASAGAIGTAGGWLGDWRSGAQEHIAITRAPGGRIAIKGDASFGAGDPDRVKRGAVNTGDFAATVAPVGGRLAFVVGGDGRLLPYDARRAKDEGLCSLKLWRLGPYLVAADNLQCGGNGVTFAGVYRRAGAAR